MKHLDPPALIEAAHSAVFLDFDGTLVDFAEIPDAVHVPRELTILLENLSAASAGALAVVSGRQIDALDALLAPLVLPLAGLHGQERRTASGQRRAGAQVDTQALATVLSALHDFARRSPQLLVEDKRAAVALHYRMVPALEAEVVAFAATLEMQLPATLLLEHGHRVIEIRAAGVDKGSAITAFMAESPFHGRRPVFVGDDRTDEHGFAAVNAMGGLTVKVGAGNTQAATRLPDPAAVVAWLLRSISS